MIDATETPTNAQKKTKQSYSGGKKKNTRSKTQVIIEQETKNYCNKFFARKKHDYALFKESKNPTLKNTKLIVDSGYQGIQKITQCS
ncbi:transposase [Spiroplasma poulsonii]|uniref:transposase n=1 Tax=Spiroplasma poulsonii TaxID=2138 RepID=UPI0038D44155